MKKNSLIALVLFALLGFSRSGSAEVRINPFIAAGITDGGDSIGSYTTSFWGSRSDVSVGAGESGFIFGGASFVWPAGGSGLSNRSAGLLVQGGVMDGGTDYSDEFDLNRNAIELMGIVEWSQWRFGIGLSHHLSPKLVDASSSGGSIRFSDATGPMVQFDWMPGRITVGIRYVDIDYESTSRRLDAANVGVVASWRFGWLD